MYFNFEKYIEGKEKAVVHCATANEAEDFIKKLRTNTKLNIPEINNTHWDIYKEETCYRMNGAISSKNYFKLAGYEIIEWANYMED